MKQHEKKPNTNNCYSASRNKVQYEKNAIQKKVQHEQCTRWRKSNTEKVQPKKCATRKNCNIEKVQHKKIATWKKCNMKRVQHEATRKK